MTAQQNAQRVFENVMRRNEARRAGIILPKDSLSFYLMNGSLIYSDGDKVEDIIGTTVRDENGLPLKPAKYILATGERMTVGKDGKVTGMEYDPAVELLY